MHTVLYVKHWGAEQQGSVHAVGNGAWQTEYQECFVLSLDEM